MQPGRPVIYGESRTVKFIGTVADVWQEPDHIVVVTDAPDWQVNFSNGDIIELRCPNGNIHQAKGNLILFDPPADRPFAVVFTSLAKVDVPLGSSLWLVRDERPPGKPTSLSRKFTKEIN